MPKVNINISATDDASAVIRKVTAALKEQEKGSGSLTGSFVKGNLIMKGLEAGFEGLKTATVDLTMASMKSYGTMEQNNIALRTMLGSAQMASQVITEMQVAAKETPFEMQEIVSGGKNLIAFGESADTVVETMKMLGDVASGVSIPINDLITKYGQIRTQGRAMTMDLREFAGRGIPIYSELAKTMKINETQVTEFASAGKIGFKEIEAAFRNMSGEGGKFHDLMKEQSKSLNGMISNLSDSYDILLTQIGARMEEEAKRGVEAVSQSLKEGGLLNDILIKTGEAARESLGLFADTMDSLDEEYRKINGTAKDFTKNGETAAKTWNAAMHGLSVTTFGLSLYLKKDSDAIDEVSNKYKTYLEMGIKGRDDLEKYNKHFDDLENSRLKVYDKKKEKDSGQAKQEIANSRKKSEEAQKYYNDLVYNSAMAEASDLKRIDLTTQKELDALKLKSKYLTDSQVNTATGIITSRALSDKDKLEIENKAKVFDAISGLQTKFYTQSASEEANAIGEMSQTLTESFKTVASDVSKILNDIAADSRKSGLSMGDSFKVGASVATAALQSISAVMNMQQQMAQANYDRQLEMLRNLQDAELDALDAKYEAEQEAIDTKYEEDETAAEDEEAARLLDLEAYRLSLRGKTDAEIEAALEKKKLALKAKAEEKTIAEKKAAEEAALEKKKAAEQAQIEKDYAIQEWMVEVQAFKSKQDYDKKAVVMAAALGIVQAWASAMMVPFPGNVIVGGVLTALMAGTAAAQLGQISSQSPPAPPAFASGVTNFEGGLAIVGEKGRELVNLPAGANVLTNENTEKILSSRSSGPDYIINNIYLNGILTQQDIVDLRKASGYGGY